MLAGIVNRGYKRAIAARLSGTDSSAAVPDGGRTEQQLIMAIFAVMGRLAKLDGLVTKEEVDFATAIMQKLDLDYEQREQAINYFNQGKQLNRDVMGCVRDLAKLIEARSPLARLFITLQVRLACLKGEIRLKEKVLLRDVAETLGFNKTEFLAVCSELLGHGAPVPAGNRTFLSQAYQLLQLEPNVADEEIRRAYLRMISRYHPDKLVGDDLSEEALQQAQDKFMAIRNAYETLCGYRRIRV